LSVSILILELSLFGSSLRQFLNPASDLFKTGAQLLSLLLEPGQFLFPGHIGTIRSGGRRRRSNQSWLIHRRGLLPSGHSTTLKPTSPTTASLAASPTTSTPIALTLAKEPAHCPAHPTGLIIARAISSRTAGHRPLPHRACLISTWHNFVPFGF
jgi:hypothetical protein